MVADRWSGPVHHFDLERAADLARLTEPELALEPLDGLIVLDEIQRRPDLFPALRVLIDRHPDRRYLILGSGSPDLLQQSSETLAGRIAYYDLPPLTVDEVGGDREAELWIRGGFPRSFLAPSDEASFEWRLNRFWKMLAHVHGQVWNGSRFGSSFGVADTTVRRYLDLLTSALVVRPDRVAVERHPTLGASWEGYVVQQLSAVSGARDDQQYIWATHSGAELDLLVVRGTERLGFEIKRTTAPKVTRSLRSAIETLELDRTFVVHAGEATYPLGHGVEALAARDLAGPAGDIEIL